ncbi:MAG: substrate-binding domain-containing protein [Desulfomonilaceae bacterium]
MKNGSIVVVILTLTILLSCPGYASDRVKIGLILKTMQEERYQKDRSVFLAKAKALGVIPLFDSCYDSEMEQVSRFENMLAQGVKVIVLQPVNTGTAAILVTMAHQQGVRVVGYDSLPMNSPLDVMVMQDSWAVGKLQCEALVNWFKARKSGKVEGKVALIMGQPGDSNADFMSEGAVEVLRANKGLDLVIQEAHRKWDPARAKKTTEKVLAKFGNQVDAFICNNDSLATGVIAALKERGLDHVDRVFVAGADADLVNIRYIVKGIQAVDVWKMIDPLAETAAEVAVKLARNPGKKITEIIKPDKMVNNGTMEVPTIVTPVKLVTRDNINETLIKGGVYTTNQIYGAEPISENLR